MASIKAVIIVCYVASDASIIVFLHECDRNMKEGSEYHPHVKMKRSMCQPRLVGKEVWDVFQFSIKSQT